MSTLQPRLTALASTLAAGSALASAAMVGGVPITPTHSSLFTHHNVALTATTDLASVPDNLFPGVNLDTTTFGGSFQWLMDNMLGIGGTTLPNLIDPKDTTTLESLLAPSGLGVSSSMTDVFNQLGLQNFNIYDLMQSMGLPAGSTLDDLLGHLGLATLTVDQLMTGMVGFGTGETLVGLVDTIGFGDKSIGDLMGMLGLPTSTTVDGLLSSLGVGELGGLLSVMGVGSTTDLGALLSVMGSGTANLTLDQLMSAATSADPTGYGVLSSIGEMTIGQMIGLTTSTTLKSALDNLQMGSSTLGEMLGLVQITSSTTLGGLLGDLPLGVNGNTTLGADSLGDVLTQMLTSGSSITSVDATTTMNGFLTGIGLGDLNLDNLLGLDTTP